MKEIIKDFIFTKWAEYGLEPSDIKNICSNICLIKKAENESVTSALFSTIPLAMFTIPALGGALFYNFTNPNLMTKNKLKKKQRKMIEEEIEDIKDIRNNDEILL